MPPLSEPGQHWSPEPKIWSLPPADARWLSPNSWNVKALWKKSPLSVWMNRPEAIYRFVLHLMFNDSLCRVFWLLTNLTVLLLPSQTHPSPSVFPARSSSLVFLSCWIIPLSRPLSMYRFFVILKYGLVQPVRTEWLITAESRGST